MLPNGADMVKIWSKGVARSEVKTGLRRKPL